MSSLCILQTAVFKNEKIVKTNACVSQIKIFTARGSGETLSPQGPTESTQNESYMLLP